jgi:hypothetical protein
MRRTVMIGKSKSSKKGQALPTDWLESVARLLNETYNKDCEQNGRYFDTFGQVYPEELVLVVSFLSEKNESDSAITLFLSSGPEHIANEAKVKNTQKNFIELTGLFFDEILGNKDWNEFEPNWQEVSHNNETYSFKISRENINITLEANRLLGDEFDDLELDSDLDQ